MESRFHTLLRAKITKVVETESTQLVSGQAPDYASYKEGCAYIRGLMTALELCGDIEREND